jgi:hypothetical protein
MFIPDPDFYPFRIPDLGSRIQKQQQNRGVKKIVVKPCFGATNSQNCKLFYFSNAENKIWASFQRIIDLITQKFVTKLLKIWGWDPRSGIRKKIYSGSRIREGSKRHRIPDPGSATLAL